MPKTLPVGAPSLRQEEKQLAELKDLLASILNALPALYRRARIPAGRDGYPASTLNDGAPQTTVDEYGIPMPPLSDPTGETAVSPQVQRGPVDGWAAEAASGMGEALGGLRRVVGAIDACREHDKKHYGRGVSSVGTCAACGEPDRIRRGLCSACYQWWLREGKPEMSVVKKERG